MGGGVNVVGCGVIVECGGVNVAGSQLACGPVCSITS